MHPREILTKRAQTRQTSTDHRESFTKSRAPETASLLSASNRYISPLTQVISVPRRRVGLSMRIHAHVYGGVTQYRRKIYCICGEGDRYPASSTHPPRQKLGVCTSARHVRSGHPAASVAEFLAGRICLDRCFPRARSSGGLLKRSEIAVPLCSNRALRVHSIFFFPFWFVGPFLSIYVNARMYVCTRTLYPSCSIVMFGFLVRGAEDTPRCYWAVFSSVFLYSRESRSAITRTLEYCCGWM